MKKLLVFGHPSFEESVFNRNLIETLKDTDIDFLNIDDYIVSGDYASARKLYEVADEIIYQFPFYWFGEPHNFKQFNEELFIHGWAFSFDGESALKDKTFKVITTCASPKEAYTSNGRYKHDASEYLLPMKGLSYLSEMKYVGDLIFYSCHNEPTEDDIKQYLSFLRSDHIE